MQFLLRITHMHRIAGRQQHRTESQQSTTPTHNYTTTSPPPSPPPPSPHNSTNDDHDHIFDVRTPVCLCAMVYSTYFVRDASSQATTGTDPKPGTLAGHKTRTQRQRRRRRRRHDGQTHVVVVVVPREYVYDLCRKVIYRPEIAYCEKLTSCARVMTTHRHNPTVCTHTHGAAMEWRKPVGDRQRRHRCRTSLMLLPLLLLLLG